MSVSNPITLTILFPILLLACKDKTTEIITTERRIEMYDPELQQVLDSNVIIEILTDSVYQWAEGPLWLDEEHKLLFTDVPQNTIYSWDEKNGPQKYLSPSGYTIINEKGGREGANGLALDADSHLILCQHGNRAVAKMKSPLTTPKDSFEFLAMNYKGRKFNSPNDLHITKDGDIFFTDPPYGLPGQDADSIKELSFNGVYRLIKKDGSVFLLDSTLSRPNGIALSSDEKYMYVANSDPEKSIWKKYELDVHKNIVSASLFADVTHLVPKHKGLPDGMKISNKGYIFASGPGGILVFNQDSRHLGTIMTGQATANCALDKDEKYLYMTAHKYLMRVRLK
ncbi:MAG: SMP-30/gluconolactonase/LRE family protein [Saprospiraceae bacterium]|nr:SMP-30/gluconolactonase/LRE family protein [Saprospiraceae bacterium]